MTISFDTVGFHHNLHTDGCEIVRISFAVYQTYFIGFHSLFFAEAKVRPQ